MEFTTNQDQKVSYVPGVNYRSDWKKGQKIDLLYDPQNPKNNIVPNVFWLKYPIICIIALLYIIYYIFIEIPLKNIKKKKDKKSKFTETNI